MKSLSILARCALGASAVGFLALAPAFVIAEPAQAGAFDWFVGTWSCKNANPTPIGGPASQTVTISHRDDGSLYFQIVGAGFERSGYYAYVPATKTWWNPFSYPSGNSARESTTQTGRRTTWTGPYFSANSDTTEQVRDTYTLLSPTKYTDVGQYYAGGSWHTGFSGTCTKP
jgi:hypothetical protein